MRGALSRRCEGKKPTTTTFLIVFNELDVLVVMMVGEIRVTAGGFAGLAANHSRKYLEQIPKKKKKKTSLELRREGRPTSEFLPLPQP